MRIFTVQATAVSTVTFTAPEDLLLLELMAVTGFVVASSDPALIRTDISNPGSAVQRESVIAYCVANLPVLLPRAFPIVKDEKIYLAFSSLGTVFLYCDQMPL
jgi:hypothetical protein